MPNPSALKCDGFHAKRIIRPALFQGGEFAGQHFKVERVAGGIIFGNRFLLGGADAGAAAKLPTF